LISIQGQCFGTLNINIYFILIYCSRYSEIFFTLYFYTSTHKVGAILQSPCPSVRSHLCNRYLSFYWKKWFYISYMALAWWLVPYLPFPGLPHIYFLFTVRLRIFHVCRNENFRNVISASTGRNDLIFLAWWLSRFTAYLLPVYSATYKWMSGGILSTTWRATSCWKLLQ
jgi:hypothetical protein